MALRFQPHKVPVVGPMFFSDPASDHQQQQAHQMALSYQAMRPEMAMAALNAMRQGQAQMGPYQGALAGVYGPNAQLAPPPGEPPIALGAMNIGAPAGSPMLGGTWQNPTFFQPGAAPPGALPPGTTVGPAKGYGAEHRMVDLLAPGVGRATRDGLSWDILNPISHVGDVVNALKWW